MKTNKIQLLLSITCSLILTLCLYNSVLAWDPVQQISDTESNSVWPSMAIDKHGNIHAVWQDTEEQAGGLINISTSDIFYAVKPKSNVDESEWLKPTLISINQNDGDSILGIDISSSRSQYAQIIIDNEERLIVVWNELTTEFFVNQKTDIYYSVYDPLSADWSVPGIVAPTENLDGIPHLVSDGNTTYAFWPTDTTGDTYANQIVYSIWQPSERGFTWSEKQAVPINTGSLDMVAVAFDSQNHLHLIWNGNTTGVPSDHLEYQIYHSIWDSIQWTEPVNVSKTDDYSFMPAIAIDTEDQVHILWSEVELDFSGQPIFSDLLYQRSENNQWLNEPLKLSNRVGVFSTRISADSRGYVHLLWTENVSLLETLMDFRVHYSRWDGATLLPSIEIARPPGQNSAQSVADLYITPQNNIYAIWAGGDEETIAQIYLSELSKNQISLTDVNHSMADTPIMISDRSNHLHMIWSETNDNRSWIMYSNRQGETWSNPKQITPSDFIQAGFGRLSVDLQDNLHLVWHGIMEEDATDDIFYSHYINGDWSDPFNISANIAPSAPQPASRAADIAVDDGGKVHIVWRQSTIADPLKSLIYYRTMQENIWSEPFLLSPQNHYGNMPDITLDTEGNPHVVWYDQDEEEIYYSTHTDESGWSTPENISQTPMMSPHLRVLSQGPEIAVDVNDQTHIVWVDSFGLIGLDSVLYVTSTDDGWTTPQEIMSKPEENHRLDTGIGTNVQIVTSQQEVSDNAVPLHILWNDYNSHNGIATIYHSLFNNDRWSSPTVILNEQRNSHRPSATLDQQGQLHLASAGVAQIREIFHQTIENFNWIKTQDENDRPITNVQVYQNGLPIGQTDWRGILQPEIVRQNDKLLALSLVDEEKGTRDAHNLPNELSSNWTYRTYIASWEGATSGDFSAHTVSDPEQEQLLVVKAKSPLILFNIVISVEWNATEAYLDEISRAAQRASDYLYDLTDGQMAFRHVAIYDNAQKWNNADIQISAKNTLIPHAYVGGILSENTAHVIRVGPQWDRVRSVHAPWDASDGYRTLIHEFGHYALQVYDEYFRYEYEGCLLKGQVRDVACVKDYPLMEDEEEATLGSAMYYQYNTTELSALGVENLWSDLCKFTAHWQQTKLERCAATCAAQNWCSGTCLSECTEEGESVWETLARTYADTSNLSQWSMVTPIERGHVLAGPNELSDALPRWPEITIEDFDEEVTAKRILTVYDDFGEIYQRQQTLVYLYQNNGRTLNQGFVSKNGQMTIYGAAAGDRLRAISTDGQLVGEIAVTDRPDLGLSLKRTRGSGRRMTQEEYPYIHLIADPSGSGQHIELSISILGLDENANPTLIAREPGTDIGKILSTHYTPVEGSYESIQLFTNSQLGIGQVETLATVSNGTDERILRLVTTYRLHQVDNSQSSDLFSGDGNFNLHLDPQTLERDASYVTIVSSGIVPGPVPDHLQLIGEPYEITLSNGQNEFTKSAIIQFIAPKTSVVAELEIFHWDNPAKEWHLIPSEKIEDENELSAVISQPGIYVLMHSSNSTPEPPTIIPPTATFTATHTPTPEPTIIPTNTDTLEPTATPTATEIPVPTATATLIDTPSSTIIPTDTSLPTVESTITPTFTDTPTPPVIIPTDISSPTTTPAFTDTPPSTIMPTDTSSPTIEYTITPPLTETPMPTITPTDTNTSTVVPTFTGTPMPTITLTKTSSPTIEYTVTPTFTNTPTLTITPTYISPPTVQPTVMPTFPPPTITPTYISSPTIESTVMPTFPPPTITPTDTSPPTVEPTVTLTLPPPTIMPTNTSPPTIESTVTPTDTPPPTIIPTDTSPPTAESTVMPTFTGTLTPISDPEPEPTNTPTSEDGIPPDSNSEIYFPIIVK